MKTKSIILLVVVMGAALAVSAQNEDDAIRYTNIVPMGTARFTSMGGAMGAIGGDLTASVYNPAGLSVYRSDQLSFSMMWTNDKSTSKYFGTTSSTNTGSFKFSNVGFVSVFPTDDDDNGLKMFNFGFIYNRMANFEGGYVAKGYNNASSLLDKAVDDFNADPWEGDPFFKSDLFIYDSVAHKYYNDYEDIGGVYGSNQRKAVTTEGNLGEYNIIFGANFNDAWYLGGSLNIMRVNYRQRSKYTETPDIKDFAFEDFSVLDEFWTIGGGVNLKLGVIGWLNESLRIGAAFHTPTILSLCDDYGTRVESAVYYTDENGKEFISKQNNNTTGTIDWELTLPAKFIGSVAVVARDRGMINLDCELVNYSSTSMNVGDDYDETNGKISDIYHTAFNARLGGEMTFGPAVVRAGFGFYGSPYVSNHVNSSANQFVYSIGAGYRGHYGFIDMGYSLQTKKETTYLYTYSISEASLKRKLGNFIVTAGVRF